MHDPLTGLANRRLLIDRMSMAMAHARRTHEGMALVYLDLDGFKLINDQFGHEAGDNVLRMVAERLLGNMREADTVARLGGDEFMLVLSQVDGISDTATAVLKVIKAVSQPYGLASQVVSLTTSAGVAVFPDHGEDVDALMRRADAALYEAKRAGKNTFRMAKPTGTVPYVNDNEEGVIDG
jgi:diguanylate cyclase (GGDEF)-like protein